MSQTLRHIPSVAVKFKELKIVEYSTIDQFILSIIYNIINIAKQKKWF